MLPFQIERLQTKLVQMGLSPRLVESMPPWSLLRNYHDQLLKREKLKLLEAGNEWETSNTYSGAKAPYRFPGKW
ncbi:hypothetical protein [Pelotomaculum propionicicum]|uniref:Uncharacterized protein n=1 Tax=Pelotomaculum propionicicum TaxID=258475 RepID=A0A4Y7RUM2_9FIRM|nr:hypothetical protein [Pelotomaculum propionicicum]NLI14580.1 hypothetical protein [Peptococcaceae bacterium]TEB12392.1 hypothetical protein Pmgp_01009 [Pelotomaculum propionicicum]